MNLCIFVLGSEASLKFKRLLSDAELLNNRWRRVAFKFFTSFDEVCGMLSVDCINILLVVGYPKVLPRQQFILFDEAYNIHSSLLPQYPGLETYVIPWINGDKITGLTLHKINVKIDSGEIVTNKKIEIPLFSTPNRLAHDLAELTPALVSKFVNQKINKKIVYSENDAKNIYKKIKWKKHFWIIRFLNISLRLIGLQHVKLFKL